MDTLRRILFFTLVIIMTDALAGGGWPQKKKGYFAKLSEYTIISKYYFASDGTVIDIPRSSYFGTQVYFEYGITDKLTAIGNIPFFARSSKEATKDGLGMILDPAESINSLGDIDLAFKYGFYQNNGWALATQLTVGIPLGENNGGNSGMLQTGDGEFNQMIEMHLSKSLKNNAYMSLTAGFNNRASNFSDEFRYLVEGGKQFGKFWGILRVNGVKPVDETSEITPNYGVFGNRVEYLGISPEISYSANDNFGVAFGAGFAAYGKNLLASPSFSIGIYLKSE